MAISVRTRFEVFKRDNFTCQYCGKKSPEVVLEADHIVPRAEGGSDDIINIRTSCWDCNRGKSDKPLSELVTGEDPHDRAVLLLERERQLREYNLVLRAIDERVSEDFDWLVGVWEEATGKEIYGGERTFLRNALERYPAVVIKQAMQIAVDNRKTYNFAYVAGILKRRREQGEI